MQIFLAIIATIALIGVLVGLLGAILGSEMPTALGLFLLLFALTLFVIWCITSVWVWAIV